MLNSITALNSLTTLTLSSITNISVLVPSTSEMTGSVLLSEGARALPEQSDYIRIRILALPNEMLNLSGENCANDGQKFPYVPVQST